MQHESRKATIAPCWGSRALRQSLATKTLHISLLDRSFNQKYDASCRLNPGEATQPSRLNHLLVNSTMTPIRVRGKKGSQKIFADPDQHSRHFRRLLVRRDRMVDISRTARTSSRASKSCSTPKLSLLERLPREIVQMIFLESLNINLPRASPRLASILSSFYIKSQLFFIAFSSEDLKLRHEDQLMRILQSSKAIAKLQSDILQLPWMTLDFLHQCIPLYLENKFHRTSKLSHFDHSDETLTGSLSKLTAPKLGTDDPHEAKLQMRLDIIPKYGWLKRWWFGTSNSFISITSPGGWVDLHLALESERLQSRMLHCQEGCLIPEKLLRGPWTPSQCEFLKSLIHAGATIDWIGSTSGEVADLGFQDALKEQSLRAIRILTQRYAESHSNYFQRGDPSTLSHEHPESAGLGFRPTSRHLKLAAVNYNCNLEILKIIKFAGEFELRVNMNGADRALFAWAEQKKFEGDARGGWLLRMFCYNKYSPGLD